jgi:hypothetical protein
MDDGLGWPGWGRRVDVLGEAEKTSVWRCPTFTVAWIDGEWCWLNRDWVPLTSMPAGPFVEIENPVFSDYRNNLFKYHKRT